MQYIECISSFKFWKKLFKYFFIFLLVILLLTFGIGFYFGYKLYEELSPQAQKIIDYKPNEITQVFDSKNRLLANLFDGEYRFYAKYDEIPGRVIEALLAVEDTLFFEHGGINLDAIIRAAVKNLQNMKYREGGSTLTQQLVKSMLLSREKTLTRKFKEVLLSIRLEQVLSKEEILERYLNYVFLGHGYFGIKAATSGYFNKNLKDLTLKEIAMLVAIPKSPLKYDPTRNLPESLSRANSIIKRMFDLGWINQIEYRVALNEVPMVYNNTLTKNKTPYVIDEMLRQIPELSNIKDIKSGGYKVYLTIDLEYQEAARNSLINGRDEIIYRIKNKLEKKNKKNQDLSEDDIKYLKNSWNNLNGAMVVTNPHTGQILALVGGVDYARSSFNRATQSNRQFGSTIKPFIYEIALNSGYSTATNLSDSPISFNGAKNKIWKPNNFNRNYRGFVTLQYALEHSLNIPTINLSLLVGERKIYNELSRFGFTNIPQDLSIVLGSLSLSPLKAAEQYSLFSNSGEIVKPYLISKIVDRNGKQIIFETERKRIVAPEQGYLITSILKNVVQRGTGARAKINGIDIAGKTGTTNDFKDAWFSGFTPDIQAIIWYGMDNNTSIGNSESGGIVSAPVFKDFLTKVLKFNPALRRKFEVPKNIFSRVIDGDIFNYTSTSVLPDSSNFRDDEILF